MTSPSIGARQRATARAVADRAANGAAEPRSRKASRRARMRAASARGGDGGARQADLWTAGPLGTHAPGLAYAVRRDPFRRVDFARPSPAASGGAVATSVPTGNRRGCGAAGRQGGASPGARDEPRSEASGRAQTRRAAMAVVSMQQLLDSGVHFGHQTRRWN